MGYPYGETYLQEIQSSKRECEEIEQAFYVLRRKYAADNHLEDVINLTIAENFKLLGEAFELASMTLDAVTDGYHFVNDIIEALLTPKGEK